MNSSAESVKLLDPSPQAIVDFISKVVNNSWPDNIAQSDAYFASIQVDIGPASEQVIGPPETTQGELFVSGLHAKHGSWDAVQGRLFGLSLFFYGTEQGATLLAEAGFEAVRDRLKELYGKPLDEATDDSGNRSALWHTHGTFIELYGHVTAAPMLQLGLRRMATTR